MIQYIHNPLEFDIPAISRLLDSVGMRQRDHQTMKIAIANSSDCIVVQDGDEVVGFGRMMSDHAYYASIWDVAVAPVLQGQGIGTSILHELLKHAEIRNLRMVLLVTEESKREFYDKFGFVHHQDYICMLRIV